MTASNDLAALRAAAASGTPDDLYRLGLALVGELRMEEAYAAHAKAAEAGHAAALVECGRMRLNGVGTGLDVAGAVDAFEQAEAADSAIGAYFLALIGLGGHALPRDATIGERLLRAMQAGYPPAMRAAAIHFGRKPNLQDQALAVQLLDHAAGRGDPVAAHLLAERLRRGEGITANPEAASKLRARLREGGFDDLPEVIAVPAAPKRPSPPATLTLDEALDPPGLELLNERPGIARVEGLLSVDECRLLIALAQPMLQAQANAAQGTSSGGPGAVFDPVLEDFALRQVQLRMAAAAGVELVHAEPLRVLHHGPGDAPAAQLEGLAPEALENDRPSAGNRMVTVCAYLSTPDAGGATVFPGPGLEVEARAGHAVVFDVLDAEGRPDPASLHLSQPVTRGHGWLAMLRLRQRRYRAY